MTKKAKPNPVIDSSLPKGYTSTTVTGNFGVLHDFEKHPILQGKCTHINLANKGKKTENRVMTIKQSDGILKSLWCSYMLEDLFDSKPIGKSVYIEYQGERAMKKGRNPLKLFVSGVK
jgi:hypothetical protein